MALTDPTHPDQKFEENEMSASQIRAYNSGNPTLHTKESRVPSFEEAYNSCAGFGLVPTIRTTEKVPDKFNLSEVTLHVELPEHNIFVSVKATVGNHHLQEQVAFDMFNTKMKECGLLNDSEPAQVSPKSLNLLNAEKFVRFSRDTADISFSQTRHFKYFIEKVQFNDVVVGTGCSASKTRASEAAWLATAVHMANADPTLLELYFDYHEVIPTTDIATLHVKPSHIQEILDDPTLIQPVNIHLPPKNLLLIENALTGVDKAHRASRLEKLKPDDEPLYQRGRKTIQPLTPLETSRRSEQLLHTYRQYERREDLQNLRRARSRLPASTFSRQIFDMISESVYSIIIGATGSGKTTQVPQIILDHFIKSGKGAECNIVCTQPRVIGALSVAKRVAEERGQEIGDQIGYHVRLNAVTPMRGGSITYCTTGVILRQLQIAPNNVFENISHIIIDEVHARDLEIDFCLTVLKAAVLERLKSGKKVPRIIIMSATVNSDLFASYLEINDPELGLIKCPTLEVPGRAFSVQETYLDDILKTLTNTLGETAMLGVYQEETTRKYLEAEAMLSDMQLPACLRNTNPRKGTDIDMDGFQIDSEQVPLALVAATVTHLATTTKEGAILVFLTGFEKLIAVKAMLEGQQGNIGRDFQDQSKYRFFLLHSALTEDQQDVFKPMPKGCRKIILSTNVAETSVTISDVKYVVDSGKHREYTFDQRTNISSLPPTWISQSSSKQRAGRAGRVQDGHYYALFTKRRHEMLLDVEAPEFLRVDLQQTCLSVKAYDGSNIRHFLAQAIEPPSLEAVDGTISSLTALEALTADEEITPLGRLLVSLPLHPSLGKLVVLGIVYRCLDPMLVLAASLAEHRLLFKTSVGMKKASEASKIEFSAGSRSDHIGLINAFNQLRRIQTSEGNDAMEAFATKSFLSSVAFVNSIGSARKLEILLETLGLSPPNEVKSGLQYGPPSLNENSSKEELVRAIIAACTRISVRKSPNLYDAPTRRKVIVHPGSVNRTTVGVPMAQRMFWPARQRLLAYSSITMPGGEDLSAFLRETTDISPLTAALFGRELSAGSTDNGEPVLKVDGWIDVKVPRESSERVIALQRALRDMEKDTFVRLNEGRFDGGDTVGRDALLEDLVKVLEQDAVDVEMIALESEMMMQSALWKVEKREAAKEEGVGGAEEREQRKVREKARLEGEEAQKLVAEVVGEWRRSGFEV